MGADFNKQIGCPDLLVLFTNTVSHKMVRCALDEIDGKHTDVVRCHTNGKRADGILENCFAKLRGCDGGEHAGKISIDHCSPTLASLKTLVCSAVRMRSGESLAEDVWQWSLQMKDKDFILPFFERAKKSAGLSVPDHQNFGKRSSEARCEVPAGVRENTGKRH